MSGLFTTPDGPSVVPRPTIGGIASDMAGSVGGPMLAAGMGASLIGGAVAASGTLAGGDYAKQAGQMQRAIAETKATSEEQIGELQATSAERIGEAQAQVQETGGRLQKASADYEATQLEQNASQAVAAAQRTALDTRLKTNLTLGTLRANAAGSGVNPGVGSPATVGAEIAQRGEYDAAMDLFNGNSAATGLINKATGTRYSGDVALYGADAGAALTRAGYRSNAALTRAGYRSNAALTRAGGIMAESSGAAQQQASKAAALGELLSSSGKTLAMGGQVMYPTPRGGFGARA